MVRAESMKNMTVCRAASSSLSSSTTNVFDEPSKFAQLSSTAFANSVSPVVVVDNHSDNFYSETPATAHNADYEVVDERTKSRDGGNVAYRSDSNIDVFDNSHASSKFRNIKHAHPFSASILKTTKSIAESLFNNF